MDTLSERKQTLKSHILYVDFKKRQNYGDRKQTGHWDRGEL